MQVQTIFFILDLWQHSWPCKNECWSIESSSPSDPCNSTEPPQAGIISPDLRTRCVPSASCINTATSHQQQLRQESSNSVLSPTVVKRRDVNTKTTARSSAANLLLISYETSIICRLFSPIIWKTVNNVPYLLLTHFRCFQDKNPSSFLTQKFSHNSSYFYTFPCPVMPFWDGRIRAESESVSEMQVHHCGLTQWEQDALFCHACWLLWVFLFHRVYPASRASLLQLASASFTANQSINKV